MLDIQFIRENPELVQEKSKQKGYVVDIKKLLLLDTDRRTQLTQIEELRRKRNAQAGAAKGQKPNPEQLAAGKKLKEELAAIEADLGKIETEYFVLLKQVPNMPLDDVPVGETEDENVVSKTVGEPTKFDFTPKNHAEIAEAR